jgi:hypothetical protein
MRYCERCDAEMPDYEVCNICEACDHELYNLSKVEQERGKAESEDYERYCEEQQSTIDQSRW